MEFWGIEVKPGETVKVNPGDDYYLHVSQVALGETKGKGNENVLIFLKHNDQKLVIGTLSADKCAQIQYDLVVEEEFELSHTSKNTSIYFCGYKTLSVEDDCEEFDDVFDQSESDEEGNVELAQKANGIPELKLKQAPTAQKDVLKTKSEEPKKDDKQKAESDDEDETDDSDDEDEDSSDDDDLDEEMDELDDEDDDEDEDDDSEDESDDEDEATPVKVEQSKKRPASASKTPVPEKKAKLVSPLGNQKTDDAGKKGKGKSAQQSPKSSGSISCKSCSKSFVSVNALQAHTKAKHADGK